MPFHLHVPLPGPFSYSHRLGGRRRPASAGPSAARSLLYWLLIGWWWVPVKYSCLLMWWLCKYSVVGIVALAGLVGGTGAPGPRAHRRP